MTPRCICGNGMRCRTEADAGYSLKMGRGLFRLLAMKALEALGHLALPPWDLVVNGLLVCMEPLRGLFMPVSYWSHFFRCLAAHGSSTGMAQVCGFFLFGWGFLPLLASVPQ